MTIKKKLVVSFSILVLVLLSLWYWQQSTDPGISESDAASVLEESLGRNLKEADTIPDIWQKHSGEYFEIEIPPGAVEYDLNKQGTKQNNTLERYSFDGFNPRMIFVATVSDSAKQQVKNLEDIPAVTMRKNNTTEYKIYPISSNNTDALGFEKINSSFEKTAFFIKNGRSYTFSLTADSPHESLDQIFEKMMKSLILK